MPDINFDSLFDRFNKNIYGSTKGYIRQHIVNQQLTQLLAQINKSGLCCADIGGGMGQLSQIMLEKHNKVDYFDISSSMCEAAKARTDKSDDITFHCVPFQSALNEHYDLITCQAVLEWLEDPMEGLRILCNHVAREGYIFLLFYNKASIILRNLVRGNLNAAFGDTRGNGSGLTPINPLDIDDVFAMIEHNGLKIQSWFGVRSFTDLQQRDLQQRLGKETLLKFETALSEQDPFRSIARYVGVVAKRV